MTLDVEVFSQAREDLLKEDALNTVKCQGYIL